MSNNGELIRCSMRIFAGILLLSMVSIIGKAQALPGFSGRWKQDNDRCRPKRNGVVTLHIEHNDPNLTLETLVNRDSMTSRHAIQKYTTDGKPSTSTGTDGDEFHTAVTWTNSGLVFSVEEHENGQILPLERDVEAH